MTDSRPELPELRRLALAEVFDGAMALTVRSYRFLVPLLAAVMLPFQLVAALLSASTRLDTAVVENGSATLFTGTRSDVVRRVAAAVVVQAGALVLVSVVVIVAVDALLGRSASRMATLRYALRRVPALLAYFVLSTVVIGAPLAIGLALTQLSDGDDLGVPGVIGALMVLAMMLWLAVAVLPGASSLLVERTGPLRALGRAFMLSRGQWRRCLAVFLVGTVLSQFLVAVLGTTVESMLDSLGGGNADFRFVWATIGGTVAMAAVVPFSASVGLVLYLDLRVRREHYDRSALAGERGSQR